MKIKVTVELEEGIKSSQSTILSTESFLILESQNLEKDRSKHLILNPIVKRLKENVSDAAQHALLSLVGVMQEYGTLYQYVDENQQKQLYEIRDINEFKKFKKELDLKLQGK